jgi:hypothetical protein
MCFKKIIQWFKKQPSFGHLMEDVHKPPVVQPVPKKRGPKPGSKRKTKKKVG